MRKRGEWPAIVERVRRAFRLDEWADGLREGGEE